MLAGRAIEIATEESSDTAGTRVAVQLRRPDFDIRTKLPTINSCKSATDLRAWLLQFARSLGFYGARYIHIGTRWWSLDQIEMPLRFLWDKGRCFTPEFMRSGERHGVPHRCFKYHQHVASCASTKACCCLSVR